METTPATPPVFGELKLRTLDFDQVSDRDLTDFEEVMEGKDLLEVATGFSELVDEGDEGGMRFTPHVRRTIRAIFWIANRRANPSLTWEATADLPILHMAAALNKAGEDNDPKES